MSPGERSSAELGNALNLDGCPVREHLGDALHHFGGVIAHADDSVCSVLGGMLEQQSERIFAGLLAEIRGNGDVSADNGCRAAPRFPITLRERTIIPRTMPKFLTTR